ncbi:hypothetical protein Psi02_30140 [Planotetraspora silvatica]|uniref:Oxygen sensor histidine kinase NreB n=1 Tax=Planotetraspora silvatica TaxID=234614 RepID=A0A8J3UY63_9ACTN|nr:ATP-binding protein [Planotetraspora silvatica]GII46590.1 hypothetical protein Psi02_30140 [Planotetraspora silvatica]
MTLPAGRHVIWHTLARHMLLASVVAVVISALVTLGGWRFAEDDARRRVESVARQVAATVLVPMTEQNFVRLDGVGRGHLRDHVSPFLESGTVQRIKVFRVDGDLATVVFSDEPRVEGLSGRQDSQLATSLDPGEVLVRPVPVDAEHRYETGLAGSRLEVFLGFRDAGDNDMRLELYLPVDVPGTTRHAVLVLLPTVLIGLVLLTAATVPLSVTLARRMERDRAEQRASREYGLAAAELARRDVARRLHDGVIPNLAGVGLLLQGVRSAADRQSGSTSDHGWSRRRDLLDRAQNLLAGEVRELRTLLTELLPDEPVGRDFAGALSDLAARIRQGETTGPAPAVDIDVSGIGHLGEQPAVILHRVAGELLRNAFRHAQARTVRIRVAAVGTGPGAAVELTVTDDGVGFDPSRIRRPGHIGLRLVRRLIEDEGGRFVVISEPGAGTAVTVSVRDPALRSPSD